MKMSDVPVSVESKRGCGYRHNGYYMVSEGISQPCGRLPIPCDRCPCCGGGILPSRGWTWVDADALFLQFPCKDPSCSIYIPEGKSDVTTSGFNGCPASDRIGKAGLLWVGTGFYPTPAPADWAKEAQRMGVSRRIPSVPRDFKLGETWVLVAHRDCIEQRCDCGIPKPDAMNPDETVLVPDENCEKCLGNGKYMLPGIFHMFKPTAIQYVVKGDETEEQLDKLVKRGLTPIKVVRDIDEHQPLDLGESTQHTLADDLPGSF